MTGDATISVRKQRGGVCRQAVVALVLFSMAGRVSGIIVGSILSLFDPVRGAGVSPCGYNRPKIEAVYTHMTHNYLRTVS